MLRRIAALAFGILLALLLAEGGLQVAALVAQRRATRSDGLATEGREVILCVGDSFTYGLGASGPACAYPVRLQAALDARAPGRFAVVNEGMAGRNSRDVLALLGAMLDRLRPRRVIALVGTNDMWTRPALLPAGAEAEARESGYAFRWRLPRLFALLRSRAAERSSEPQEMPHPPGPPADLPEDDPVERAFRLLESGAVAPDAIRTVAERLFDPAYRGRVQLAIDRLRALRTPTPSQRALLLRIEARLLLRDDPDRAMQKVVDAYLADGVEAATTIELSRIGDLVGEPQFEAMLAAATPEQAATLRRLHGTATRSADDVVATLREHLARIVALCRARGAEAWFLSYPKHTFGCDELEGVAAEQSVRFLDLRPAFERRLAEVGRDALFIADGHCTDAGYQLMADSIADAILK